MSLAKELLAKMESVQVEELKVGDILFTEDRGRFHSSADEYKVSFKVLKVLSISNDNYGVEVSTYTSIKDYQDNKPSKDPRVETWGFDKLVRSFKTIEELKVNLIKNLETEKSDWIKEVADMTNKISKMDKTLKELS